MGVEGARYIGRRDGKEVYVVVHLHFFTFEVVEHLIFAVLAQLIDFGDEVENAVAHRHIQLMLLGIGLVLQMDGNSNADVEKRREHVAVVPGGLWEGRDGRNAVPEG